MSILLLLTCLGKDKIIPINFEAIVSLIPQKKYRQNLLITIDTTIQMNY
jgi:hypothetical protein